MYWCVYGVVCGRAALVWVRVLRVNVLCCLRRGWVGTGVGGLRWASRAATAGFLDGVKVVNSLCCCVGIMGWRCV